MQTAADGPKRHREAAPMNHNTSFRLRRAIVLGLVVATAIVTRSAVAAATEFSLPPGATVEPVAASTQFSLPPGATVEPAAASTQFSLPPGATVEPVAASTQFSLPPGATVEPVAASTVEPGGAPVASAPSSPALEVRGGLDWPDAGIGAGIAFGTILLLGGALLVVRRSSQHHFVGRFEG
jgi:hypothetical protein